jgi:molybdopterin/thiamine biosynthesis adenylyltransferase
MMRAFAPRDRSLQTSDSPLFGAVTSNRTGAYQMTGEPALAANQKEHMPDGTALNGASPFDVGALYSRNWAFISPELQARLENVTLFLAGVGLASQIATLACRTGFRRFILADGDTVDESNLNRQAFQQDQVGQNKAAATAAAVRAIRPDAVIETLPAFLDSDSLADPLSRADLVVNSIDFDQAALSALNRAARNQGKTTLMPLNLGWGGAVVVFTPVTPTLEEFLGLSAEESVRPGAVAKRMVERALARSSSGTPSYLTATLGDYIANGESWPNEPQLGAATALTAALVVRALVALIGGDPVSVAPDVNHLDLRAALEPRSSERDLKAISSRQRAERYPALQTPLPRTHTIFERMRPSGLRVRALRHAGLTEEMRAALTAFRLDQYALHGLYRADALVDREIATSDPSFDRLAPDAIHVLAVSADDEMLAYACMEGPVAESGAAPRRSLFARAPTLSAIDRPMFPLEAELFGPAVFASLPLAARIKLSKVCEITRITRNRATTSSLAEMAVLEVGHALARVLADPGVGLELAVGCANKNARRVMHTVRVPALYAPLATYAYPQAVSSAAYWAEPGIADGAFWPFLLAAKDFRAILGQLERLDAALSAPTERLRDTVERTMALTPVATPRALVSGIERAADAGVLWTDDPFFPTRRRGPH